MAKGRVPRNIHRQSVELTLAVGVVVVALVNAGALPFMALPIAALLVPRHYLRRAR